MIHIICRQGTANQNNEIVNFQTTEQLCLFCMLVKFMLKIHQARYQQYVNGELQEVQGLENIEEQIATYIRSQRTQGNSRKASTFASLTTQKALTVWITTNGKFLKKKEQDGNTKLPYQSPEKPVCAKKQQLEPHTEQDTGSKLGKEYTKGVYCHPIYLTSMQNTLCEMPGCKNHKLESRLLGEILTSDMQIPPP